MNKLTRGLIVAEFIVCFGPVLGLLALGLLWSVLGVVTGLFVSAIEEEGENIGSFLLLFLVYVCCGCGLYALFDVLKKVLNPPINSSAPVFIKVFICVGFLPLIFFLGLFIWDGIEDGGWNQAIWLVFLPLICSVHIIILGRKYLLRE